MMLEYIFNPPAPSDYQEFYKSLLSVSGVLFGLAFAALLFILQSGFTSFTYSRRMFLILYLHFGRQILYSLAYLTVIPFVLLYFPGYPGIASMIYGIFGMTILKATLDHAKEEGYLITINSTRYVPRCYGKVRSYFRLIRNRGSLRNIFHLGSIFFVVCYPFLVSFMHESITLTDKALVYSCILILALSLLRVTSFIPEYFKYQEMEQKFDLDKQFDEKDYETAKDKNRQAKRALKAYLQNRQIKELDGQVPVKFFDGELTLHFLDNTDNDEAFFNVEVTVKGESPDAIRNGILEYAYHIFKFLYESRADINKFVLSFHVDVGDRKSRNIFIRTNRIELETLFSKPGSAASGILEFKNYLFDPLLKP